MSLSPIIILLEDDQDMKEGYLDNPKALFTLELTGSAFATLLFLRWLNGGFYRTDLIDVLIGIRVEFLYTTSTAHAILTPSRFYNSPSFLGYFYPRLHRAHRIRGFDAGDHKKDDQRKKHIGLSSMES